MLSPAERIILKKLSETHLATKHELKNYLTKEQINANVDQVTRKLLGKNLLRTISPVGATCYIITQKGTKLLSEIDSYS